MQGLIFSSHYSTPDTHKAQEQQQSTNVRRAVLSITPQQITINNDKTTTTVYQKSNSETTIL